MHCRNGSLTTLLRPGASLPPRAVARSALANGPFIHVSGLCGILYVPQSTIHVPTIVMNTWLPLCLDAPCTCHFPVCSDWLGLCTCYFPVCSDCSDCSDWLGLCTCYFPTCSDWGFGMSPPAVFSASTAGRCSSHGLRGSTVPTCPSLVPFAGLPHLPWD